MGGSVFFMKYSVAKRFCGLFGALGLGWVLSGCAGWPGQPVSTSSAAAEVPIISVAQWGGTPASTELRAKATPHQPTRVTLHHAGVPFGRDKDPVQHLRNLQKWSRDVRQWADIPYHYIIDLDGKVFEARDVLLAGDTNTGYDTRGHALVMLLGNFEEAQPTPAQVETAVKLSAQLIRRFQMKPELLASHRDVSAGTSCPGENFYALLKSGEFQRRVASALHQ
jgi:hypothetical protein